MQIPEGFLLISKAEFEQLLNRITMLESLVKAQQSRIIELEGMLHKNSSNSHKPPGSDGYKKKIKNSREKGGKVGGQLGSEGHTLLMVEKPDKQEPCKVTGQCACGASLDAISVLRTERRQKFDLPEKLMEVTEYEIEIKQCTCGKVHEAICPVLGAVQYGPRMQSLAIGLSQYQMLPFERLQEFFKDYIGVSVSDWWLEKIHKKCYEHLAFTEEKIKESLRSSAVLHSDETGIRANGKTHWVHVAGTALFTHFGFHAKRGKEAMDDIGILPGFTGNLVHDRWSSYDHYEQCQHSLCNAHLLRDLKFVEEELKRSWAKSMRNLLIWANFYKNENLLNPSEQFRISKRYDTILRKAIAEEPTEQSNTIQKRGKKAKNESLLLLEALQQRKEQVLRFIYQNDIPFDNNQAERDLRMMKVKQKISGCFRTVTGAEIFCRIRGYIATAKKQGINVLEAIVAALNHETTIRFAPS